MMKKFIMFVVAAALWGCGNFNTITIPLTLPLNERLVAHPTPTHETTEPESPVHEVSVNTPSKLVTEAAALPSDNATVIFAPNTEINCPLYQPKPLPDTPPLPLAELEKVGHRNPTAYDEIQQRHINELRLYIMNLKKQVRANRAEYMKRCGVSTTTTSTYSK